MAESVEDQNDQEVEGIIKETEQLMENLVDIPVDDAAADTNLVFEGFSIDSDDEGEGNETNNNNAKVEVDDHPLSDNFLASEPTPAAPQASPANATFSNAGTQPLFGQNANGGSQVAASGAATMDAFKEQTTRFASNLASMAQRAAREVAAATNTVPVTGAGPVHGGPVQPVVQQSQPYHQGTPVPTYGNVAQASSSGNMHRSNSSHEINVEQQTRLINEHVGDLLPGERVIQFVSNLLHVQDTSGVQYFAHQSPDTVMWCCVVTFYRIILFSTASESQLNIPPPAGWSPLCWPTSFTATKTLQIPLGCMDKVDKQVYQAGGSSYMGLVILSKDCARVLRFTTPSYPETGKVYETLNKYAFPGRVHLGYLFAFESKRVEVMASIVRDERTNTEKMTIPPHQKRFDAMIEFPRLLAKTSITQSPWALWASINIAYQLSPTYPQILVGPSSLDESKPESQHVIRQCAAFRSEQRLPSMTWCGTDGASIWRCSQPKVGLQGNRSPADELFLRHIAESARGANAMADPPPIYPRSVIQQLTGDFSKDWIPEPGCGLKILDLRPRSAAMANRTGGYGYENTSNYINTTLQFCNIGNIHAVRDSYQKLCSLCNSTTTADVNWNYLVEETKWLSHIRLILAASWETAYWVHVWRMPVLVHCSHGWDRTSQVAALAQLLLDPFYRTRRGFSVLVEKDFMSFGHPFHMRCAHGEGRGRADMPSSSAIDPGQISPIFLQFIDCVYQIVQLYPDCFEFNTDYLLELSFNIYSNRFGTMLCDTERDREAFVSIRQRTHSLWDYLDEIPELQNKAYVESGVLLMPISTLLRNVKLWTRRHCFCGPKPTFR